MLVQLRLRHTTVDVTHEHVSLRVKILGVDLAGQTDCAVAEGLVVHFGETAEHFFLIREGDVAVAQRLAVEALGVSGNRGGDHFEAG